MKSMTYLLLTEIAKQPVNVLFVTNKLTIGGKERQIVELLRFFDANTDHHFAVCLRENSAGYDLSGSNVKIFKPYRRLGFYDLVRFQRRVIREFKPDIVHTWEAVCALAITLNLLFLTGKIHLLDGTLQYSKSFPWYSKAYLIPRFTRSMAGRVVANSNAGMDSLNYGAYPKYLVIPNGLDFERFQLPETVNRGNPDEIVIGMVAGFTAPKDFASLIKAGLRLLNKGYKVKLMFLGGGPEKAEMEAMIPPELAEKFIFTGFVNDPERYIRQFDIGVLLSKKGHSEGLSNAVLEYMAFGKPVVCTNTGGNKELITDNSNGFFVGFEDVDDVVNKLEILIRDPKIRESFGRNSYQRVRENYAMDKIAFKFIRLYNEMINNR